MKMRMKKEEGVDWSEERGREGEPRTRMGRMANSIFSGREKRGSEWKVHSAAIAMIRRFLSRAA